MSKKVYIGIFFLLYLWQLPQNLLGLLLALLCDPVTHTMNLGKHRWTEVLVNYTGWMRRGDSTYGVSLGRYIFLDEHKNSDDMTSERHEYGHSMQSLYLGPLYLIVIGLPSFIHAIWWKPGKGNYYAFPTEWWADKLGGVER